MKLGHKLARLKSAGPGGRPDVIPAQGGIQGLARSSESTIAPGDDSGARGDDSDSGTATSTGVDTQLRQDMAARVNAIRKRLEAMTQKQSGPKATSRRATLPIDAPVTEEVDGSELATALLGETIDTEWGRMHRVRKRLRPSHIQGSTPIASALDASSADFARIALDPSLEGLDLTGALYFDTETTGLAGGTGTLPFLLGLAWFEEREMVVEQLVLRQPGEEAPMLERLRERLGCATCVISYNGKSFDWPLLRTRYVMNRLEPPELPPHIDLLHCARRVFKARLPEVSLTAVEEGVLGLGRIEDIGGGQIPETYTRFLAGAPGAVLNPVIEHNAHDLISLAALLGDLSLRFQCDPTVECASDQLGLARTAFRARDLDAAKALARRATGGAGETARQAHHLAALLAKREKEWARARDHLLQALNHPGQTPSDAAISLELAKLYEHKLRDLPSALDWARRGSTAEDEAAHQKRIRRLNRKLGSELEDDDVVLVHPALLAIGQGHTNPRSSALPPAKL